MTISLILIAVIGVAIGVYMAFMRFMRSESKSRRDSLDLLNISPAVPLGLPISTIRIVPVPAEEPARKKAIAKAPRVTDPLERYKRRYGLCGRFSRRARRSRQEAAKRALDDAIRRQDLPRLRLLHAIGVR